MKKHFTQLRLALAGFLVCLMSVSLMAQRVTLDFTSNDWNLPVGSSAGLTAANTYTNDGYSVILQASTKYYFNTEGYLMIGKNNSSITLPAFDFPVEKIEVVGREGASPSTKQNIYVGSTAVSTQTTGSTTTQTYNVAEEYQGAGNIYVLKVESNHNAQVTYIKVYEKSEAVGSPIAAPTFDLVAGKYYSDQMITLTAEEGANIYYTLDGTTPSVENGILYTQPIAVNTTTTIKAIAVLDENASAVVSAIYTFPSFEQYDNVAAFKAAANTSLGRINNDVTVLFQSADKKSTFIQDESGAVYIFGTLSQAYVAGDVISGGVFGKYKLYNGMVEMIPEDGTPLAAGIAGTAVQPTEVSIDSLIANYNKYEGMLVTVSGLKLAANATWTAGSTGSGVDASANGQTIQIYNTFKTLDTTLTANSFVNVTGLVIRYNSTVEIAPRGNADITAAPAEPATLPYFADFDRSADPNFVFDNGATGDQWFVGQAQDFDNNKLFISSTNGATNKYNTGMAANVTAMRQMVIPAMGAVLNFDFRGMGENNGDYLAVEIQKGNNVATYAFSGSNEWNNKTIQIDPSFAGVVDVRFVWVNNGNNAGTQFPAAIDNIFVTEALCAQPMNVLASVEGNAATISWTVSDSTQNAWVVEYKLEDHNEWYSVNATTNSVVLNDLQGSSKYDVRVKAVCGEESSAYAEGSFLVNCLNVITRTTQQNQQINASQSGTQSSVPTDGYWEYTVSQQIYTPTELGAAGKMYSISFLNTNSRLSGPREVEVYLKQSNRTSFTSNYDWESKDGFTKVFDGDITIAANEWTEISFNRAFSYNGSSNLVLMVINKSGAYFGDYSSKCAYSVFNAGSNRAMHAQASTTAYTLDNYANYSGTRINYCNVVKFKKEVTTYECNDQISCQDPSRLAVTDVTTEGATITWTAAANEHNFVLDYKAADAEEWTSVEVNDTTYTFTGLSQKTDYLVRVKAVCGENDHSNYTDEVAFTTSSVCASVTDITNSNLSTTTTISWTPGGTETEWNLQFKPTDADEDAWVNIHIGGLSSTTFGGLMEQTEYQVRIMALCDPEDEANQSAWTYYTFTSGCAPKDLPYEEYFVTNNLPDCWETNGFTFGGQAEAAATDLTLMTPPINIPAIGNTYISFDVMGGAFSIQASYRGTAADRFTTIYTGEANEEMTHVAVLIPAAYRDKATNFLFVCNGEELTIDNVIITPCPFNPSELVAINPTVNSIQLSWNGAGAEEWILEYTKDFNTWNQVTVDTCNYVLNGLDANTEYAFRVKSHCSGSNMSDYSNVAYGTTYCAPINVPYTQEFEDLYMPSCWNTFHTGTCTSNGASVYNGALRLLNSYSASSDRGNYYGDIYAVLPEVIDTITTVQVSFNAKTYNGYNGQFAVGVLTDMNDLESFKLYKMINPTADWTENVVSFENYTLADGRIAFFMDKSFAATANQGVLIDNVVIDYIPSCPKPMAFNATVASENSVKLSWNYGGNENKWDVEYGVTGFTQGEGTMITTSIRPTTIGNLTYGQTYDFYLRARCSNDDQSVWVGPVTKTVEVSYVMGVDNNVTSCHGIIYDDGGLDGNYSNNLNQTMVVNPSSSTSLVVLEGSFNLAAHDTLFVYDGNSVNAPLYATLVDGNYISMTSSYGPFTLRLKSDNSSVASGFAFNIYCVDAPTCSEVENITFDGGNTFTWTNGYWGTPQSYNVRYRKTNESEYTVVNVSSATYSIPGMQNMAYEFGVQAVCGNEDVSDWTTIEVTKEACPIPTNLAVNVSETSAQFTWNAGQPGQTYVLEYKRATAVEWVSVSATQNTYTLSNMDAPQDYVARVKAICTTGDESEYTSEVSFTVLPAIDDCTIPTLIQNGTGTNSFDSYQIPVSSYYYNSYTQQLYTEAELTEMGIVPGAIVKTLSLNYFNSTPTVRPITVWLGTTNISSFSSGSSSSSFVAIDDNFQQVFTDNCFEFSNRDNNWSTITFEQPFIYNGGNLVISFLMNYKDAPSPSSCFTRYGGNYNFYLSYVTGKAVYCNDDYQTHRLEINSQGLPSQGGSKKSATAVSYRYNVKFGVCLGEVVNTCPAPTDIETGDITAHSVDMTWTPGGDETSWTVIYTVDGVTVDTVVNTPALTIADLNKDSDYRIPVSVYANCDLQSDAASTALVFRTLPTCFAPTDVVFNGTKVVWNGTAESYNVQYRKTGDAEYITDVTNINSYTISDIVWGDSYEFMVQSDCGEEDGISSWITITFATPECAGGVSVAIGNGTSTTSYVPTFTNYKYSYSQQIFKASEIGGVAGSINEMKIQIQSTYSYTRKLDVYLMHTTDDIISSWLPITDATKVYSGNLTLTNVDGWMTIPFTTPFEYNGTDNLVLIVDDNTGSYTSSTYFYYTTVPSGTSRYYYDDNTNVNPASVSVSGTTGDYRNNIKFAICPPPTCSAPTNLAYDAATSTLTWSDGTHGTPESYEVQYRVVGSETWTSVTTTEPTTTLSNLELASTYEAKVRSFCSAEDYSDWTNVINFTTPECAGGVSVAIGNGTSATSDVPTNTYYNYSYSQQIFKASEIGGVAGSINEMKIQIQSTYSYTRNLDVYLMHTDQNTIPTTWLPITGATKVYSGNLTLTNVDGWMTIPFTTPFAYNGTDNLVLIVDDNTGSYTNNSTYFYYTTVPSGTSRYYCYDGTNFNPASPTTSGYQYAGTSRNNVKFNICPPPTCSAPTNLAFNGATNTLTWEAGSHGTPANYEVQYRVQDAEGWTVVTTTEPTLTLNDLDLSTTYEAQVRANCSETDQSEWTSVISFSTPACWGAVDVAIGTGTYTTSAVPTNTNYNYSYSQQIFKADEIGAAGMMNEMKIQIQSTYSYTRNLDVYLMHTDQNTIPTTWLPITDATKVYSGNLTLTNVDGWMTIPFTTPFAYNGTDNLVLIVDDNTGSYTSSTSFYYTTVPSGTSMYYNSDGTNVNPASVSVSGTKGTYRNNVKFEMCPPPTCYDPTNVTVSNVTAITADVAWTPGHGETNFSLEYRAADEAEWQTIMVEGTQYTLTGLTKLTDYNVRVKAVCGDEDESDYSSIVKFTTTPSCFTPENLHLEELNSFASGFQAVIAWTDEHEQTNFAVEYKLAEDTIWTILMADTTEFDINNLAENSAYDVRVKAVCGENDESEYAKAISIVTSCLGGYDVDVVIGEGTETTHNVPVNPYFNYSYTQQIFTKDEVPAGNINAVSFQYAYSYAITSKNNVKIYLTTTDKEEFSSVSDFITDGFQLVYEGAMNCTRGWNTFNFTTPYLYDGQSNLVLIVEDNSNNYNSSSYVFNYTPTSFISCLYYQSDDDSFAEVTDPEGYTGAFRANTKFAVVGCPANYDLAVDSIAPIMDACDLSDAQVTIRVKNTSYKNSVSTFNASYQVGESIVTETVTPVTPIAPQESFVYTFAQHPAFVDGSNNVVVTIEYAEDEDARNNTIALNGVHQVVPATVPYVENFSNVTFNRMGWKNGNLNENKHLWTVTRDGVATYMDNDEMDAESYFITSCIEIPEGQYMISYDYNALSALSESMNVYIGTTPDIASMSLIGSHSNFTQATEMQNYEYLFTNDAAGIYYIAVEALSAKGNMGIQFDNLTITPMVDVTVEILPGQNGLDNGTVTPIGSLKVPYHSNLTLNIVPDNMYHLAGVWVDGNRTMAEDPLNASFMMYTLSDITEAHTISVNFKMEFHINKYAVNYNDQYTEVGGHFVPAYTDTLLDPTAHDVTMVADEHYHLHSLVVGTMPPASAGALIVGDEVISDVVFDPATRTYTYTIDTLYVGNYYVQAMFRRDTVAIEYTTIAGTGLYDGHQVAEGETFASYTDYGTDYTSQIGTPEGFILMNVIADGVQMDPISEYTFDSVVTPRSLAGIYGHSVIASVENHNPNGYLGTTDVRGTIAPDTQIVVHGDPAIVTGTVEENFFLHNFYVNGVDRLNDVVFTTDNNYTFTLDAVEENTNIVAVVRIDTLHIHYTVDAGNGIINGEELDAPAESWITLDYGSDFISTFAPVTGYHLVNVAVNGNNHGPITSWQTANITENQEIVVTLALNEYDVTTASYGNGTVSEGAHFVYGDDNEYVFVATPAVGYHISTILLNNEPLTITDPEAVFTDTLTVMDNYNYVAYFVPNVYNITATSGEHGLVTPTGMSSYEYGTSATYTITPEIGYYIASLMVDGEEVAIAGTYTFDNIVANHTIAATFAQAEFTITVENAVNGTITPGTTTYGHGATPTFTITPNVGYYVSDVTVDGESVGAVSAYTFTALQANHTIAATFEQTMFTITATSENHGTITGPATVAYGADATYTITPDAGYQIADVLVDGLSVGSLTNYTFENVTENHTIHAMYAVAAYTITVNQPLHGNITPGTTVVNYHATPSFVIAPEMGYEVATITVDGNNVISAATEVNGVYTYVFPMVTANKTLTATMRAKTFTITATAGANGTINGPTTVAYGQNATYTIVPATGYEVEDVTVDGMSFGPRTSYIFTNVVANHTIHATFKAQLCEQPSNMQVLNITTSSATLSWYHEGAPSYDIEYKKASSTDWTLIQHVPGYTYDLTDLDDNTTYVWRIKANCTANSSTWTNGTNFKTLVNGDIQDGIEDHVTSLVNVFATQNNVNIINDYNVNIENVMIYDVYGKLIYSGKVSSNREVISLNVATGTYVVRLATDKGMASYKLYIGR